MLFENVVVTFPAVLWAGLALAAAQDMGLHPGYSLMTIRPSAFQFGVVGLELLPDGDLLVLTYRGKGPHIIVDGIDRVGTRTGTPRLYRLSHVKGTDRDAITATEVASGFKDPQGLTVVNGDVYVGDIDRVVKLVDNNGDGKYEAFQEVGRLPSYNGWSEYAYGPVHKDGRLYMALAAGIRQTGLPVRQLGPGRGSVVSLPLAGGAHTVVAEGLRAPNGIALGPDDEIFVTDNQGSYRPASQLTHIVPGRFYGYMLDPPGPIQSTPGIRTTPPSLWLPHGTANFSPTEPNLMTVGPFKGQFLFGDINRPGIYRAFLEKVEDEWQGATLALSGGLESYIHRLRTGTDGEIYVGGLDYHTGHPKFGLQKLTPKAGKPPFEILAARSRASGMELEFTRPVAADAAQAAKYTISMWGYMPTPAYGGSQQETRSLPVSAVKLSPDRQSVFLEIPGLKAGQVIQITCSVTAEGGGSLWANRTWYTLNRISASPPFAPPVEVRSKRPQYTRTHLKVRRSDGALHAEWPGMAAFRLELIDLKGETVAVGIATSGKASLSTRGLRSGIHILRATGMDNARKTIPVLF